MNVTPDFNKSANKASTAPAFLSVWDIHAYYGESYIVQGVNFNVHEGEILALLGRNGAGKPRPCARWPAWATPRSNMARSGWITSRCTTWPATRPPPPAWRWFPKTGASFPA